MFEPTYPPTPNYIFYHRHQYLIKRVKKLMKSFDDPSHDWNHIVRVCYGANIMKSDSEVTIDPEMLEALCLIHDVFDHKFDIKILYQDWYNILTEECKYSEKEAICLLNIAQLISWSQFVQRDYTIPDCDNIHLWKIVSNADWYDAQLWVRAWDYTKHNISGEQLQKHWVTKHRIVKNYAFGNIAKELMEKRFNEQFELISKWVG